MCTFDGRSSTDENPTALTYSWNFGLRAPAPAPVPIKTYTSPGTFPVDADGHGRVERVTNTSAAAEHHDHRAAGQHRPGADVHDGLHGPDLRGQQHRHRRPATRATPSPTRGTGATARPLSTGATPTRAHLRDAGHVHDHADDDGRLGQGGLDDPQRHAGRAGGNQPPTAAFTASCATFTVCQTNSAGTVDPDGDAIKYAWTFGEANFGGVASTTNTSTASTRRTRTTCPGTYTITLTATDAWGKFSTRRRRT